MECTRPDEKSVLYIKAGIIKMMKVPQQKFVYPEKDVLEVVRKLIPCYDLTFFTHTLYSSSTEFVAHLPFLL